jgi:membrane protein implicated in regulation of membrane protease activity
MFLILALVLLIALPHPWNVVGLAVGLVCFAGEVGFWHRTVRHRRAVVGAQTLIGEQATVLSPCRPTGQVRVGGTIWAARCEAGADAGDTVKVVDRDRLTLIVEP